MTGLPSLCVYVSGTYLVLAIWASGRHLDTQTLNYHPSEHLKKRFEEFLEMSVSSIEYFTPQYNSYGIAYGHYFIE